MRAEQGDALKRTGLEARRRQFSGLFTGRSDATAAYRQAVARTERIVHARDDSLTAAALQKTGARLS